MNPMPLNVPKTIITAGNRQTARDHDWYHLRDYHQQKWSGASNTLSQQNRVRPGTAHLLSHDSSGAGHHQHARGWEPPPEERRRGGTAGAATGGAKGHYLFRVNLGAKSSVIKASPTPAVALTASSQRNGVSVPDRQTLEILLIWKTTRIRRRRPLSPRRNANVRKSRTSRSSTRATRWRRTSHRQQPECHQRQLEYPHQR